MVVISISHIPSPQKAHKSSKIMRNVWWYIDDLVGKNHRGVFIRGGGSKYGKPIRYTHKFQISLSHALEVEHTHSPSIPLLCWLSSKISPAITKIERNVCIYWLYIDDLVGKYHRGCLLERGQ